MDSIKSAYNTFRHPDSWTYRLAMLLYRISRYFWKKDIEWLSYFFLFLQRTWTNMEIHPNAEIGNNLLIDHCFAVVIGSTSIIGNNVYMLHGVTLGLRMRGNGEIMCVGNRVHPVIEDDVKILTGATILGPITIGKGATIAAHALVIHDVPPGTTVGGIPAVPLVKAVTD